MKKTKQAIEYLQQSLLAMPEDFGLYGAKAMISNAISEITNFENKKIKRMFNNQLNPQLTPQEKWNQNFKFHKLKEDQKVKALEEIEKMIEEEKAKNIQSKKHK